MFDYTSREFWSGLGQAGFSHEDKQKFTGVQSGKLNFTKSVN